MKGHYVVTPAVGLGAQDFWSESVTPVPGQAISFAIQRGSQITVCKTVKTRGLWM